MFWARASPSSLLVFASGQGRLGPPRNPTSQVRLSIIIYEVTEQLKKVSKGEAKILVIIEPDQNQALLVAEETKTPSSIKQS